jgi:hypothetical protein
MNALYGMLYALKIKWLFFFAQMPLRRPQCNHFHFHKPFTFCKELINRPVPVLPIAHHHVLASDYSYSEAHETMGTKQAKSTKEMTCINQQPVIRINTQPESPSTLTKSAMDELRTKSTIKNEAGTCISHSETV